METVVVLVTGSGQARGADTTLRRLVVRFALLAGFTAAGWMTTVLLTGGAASADLITLPKVPGLSADQAKSSAHKDKSGGGDLVGGLLGGVTSTVNDTLNTVTTTVNTVTTTVNSTVDMVTNTVATTVDGVTKTVTTVVDGVVQVPGKILTPQPPSGDDDHGGSLLPLPKPVTDLLTSPQQQPKTPSQSKDTAVTDRAVTETVVVAATPEAAVAPTAPTAVEAPVVEHPRLLQEARRTVEPVVTGPSVRAPATAQKVAPADNNPGPLPGPSAPVAPAAPAPTASAGGNGGSDARAILAVLAPQTLLAPPQAGLPRSAESFAEVGRSAGLPATPPD